MYIFIQAPNLQGLELAKTLKLKPNLNLVISSSTQVSKDTNVININHKPFNLASQVFT